MEKEEFMTEETRKMTEWASERLRAHGLSKELNIEILECRDGFCKGQIVLEEKHENPYGWVHGGCMMTLADTMAGTAASTGGSYVTTLNSNFHFLRAGKDTKRIIGIAKRVRNGNTILVYETEVLNDEGELLAKGDFTFFNLHKEIDSFPGIKVK